MKTEENAVANDASVIDGVVQNSVVNVLDSARNAVDGMAGTNATVDASLVAEQPAGWGNAVDAFTGKDIALDPIPDVKELYAPNEMGCAFAPATGAGHILAAKSDVDPAVRPVAIISNGGTRERLAGATKGGFGALSQGTRLIGKGVTVDVKVSSHVSLTPVGQQSAYPANLRVTTKGGRQHVYAGRWVCGLQN